MIADDVTRTQGFPLAMRDTYGGALSVHQLTDDPDVMGIVVSDRDGDTAAFLLVLDDRKKLIDGLGNIPADGLMLANTLGGILGLHSNPEDPALPALVINDGEETVAYLLDPGDRQALLDVLAAAPTGADQ